VPSPRGPRLLACAGPLAPALAVRLLAGAGLLALGARLLDDEFFIVR